MTGIAGTLAGNCIEWERYRNRDGYGRQKYKDKMVLSHRLAYVEHHGLSLEDIAGMVVRHKCDNPSCINPEHLELGTHADNVRDRQERGRCARQQGEACGNAKLTEQAVLAIREEHVPRCREYGGAALARRYGVVESVISDIIARKTWAHIDCGGDKP